MSDYLLLVIGMGAVTYLPRFIPLALLSRRRLPLWLTDWLDLIPVAILSALVAPVLLVTGTNRSFELGKKELLIAIPTLLLAVKSRSLAGTVLFGMALYWLAGVLGS